MPLPVPTNDEAHDEFMPRCMNDEIMQDEFPDEDQRYAVCQTQWEENKSMKEKVIKYNTNKAEETDEDRVLRFIGSTEAKDRDEEIIKADGWKLSNYKKNPVVLFGHKYGEPAVAKTKKVWVEDKKLMFDIEFPEPEVSSVGDSLFKLYSNGFMNATSIGFKPNYDKMEFGEKEGDPRVTYNEQELLEISLVSVPANPQALLTSKSIEEAKQKDIVDDLEIKELQNWLEELETNDNEEDINNNEKVEEEPDYLDSLLEDVLGTSEKNSKEEKSKYNFTDDDIEKLVEIAQKR